MNIPSGVATAVGHAGMYFRKNGPTILTTVGIVGFGVTTYLSGKAVLRSQPAIQLMKLSTQNIQEKANTEPGWDNQKKTRAIGEIWVHGSKDVLRIFAPAIIVGGVSVACILTSHGMLRRERAGLIAAYAALDGSMRAYRDRVRSVLGEEEESRLYADRYHRQYESTDQETGEPCVIEDVDPRVKGASVYARFFDESSKYWVKTPEYNKMFLKSQEMYANDRLRAFGYLFLNEVYESLGMERTQFGQVVGWKLDGNGDNFVSFGLDWIADESSRAFTNGLEAVVLLDFNVQGPIEI